AEHDKNKMGCPHCQKMGPHMKEHIQTLREAATALKASNPDLSKKLSDMADMKEKMMKEKKNHMKGDMKSDDMDETSNSPNKGLY
ncbi:MAG: hypothetical protein NUV91_05715, partial [Candidatus Omnitrophica bacterium]|nr:hypothetical protein [Candidatus Omnitrophota bacterium]